MKKEKLKDQIRSLNALKVQLSNQVISTNDLRTLLHIKCGLPTSHLFWRIFRDMFLIKKGTAQYTFANIGEPIYIGKLITVYQKMDSFTTKPIVIDNKTIECIQYLTSKGYTVIKKMS